MKEFNKIWKLILGTLLVLMVSINLSCEVEPDIYSEVLPEEFFQTPDQLSSASAVAYLPLGGYWGMVAENSENISERCKCILRLLETKLVTKTINKIKTSGFGI